MQMFRFQLFDLISPLGKVKGLFRIFTQWLKTGDKKNGTQTAIAHYKINGSIKEQRLFKRNSWFIQKNPHCKIGE